MTSTAPREARPVLLTVVARSRADIDTAALAAELDLAHRDLDGLGANLAEILAADPLADGPALITGTGALDHDAAAAAGLGAVLVIAADGPAGELSARRARELGATVALVDAAPDAAAVRAAVAEASAPEPVISAPLFEHRLLEKAAAADSHIVLPEGEDDRVLAAAHRLLAGKVARLTILGDAEDINRRAAEQGLDLSGAEIVDHTTDPRREEFAAEFARLRAKKGVTIEQARETMTDVSYFATMLVHTGAADGMVSGAAHTTAHTIRPALQIIKTAPEASVVSSIFLMVMDGRLWAFGDCAVNPNPSAEQLGEIAVVSARTAARFGIDPKVAVLSYSSGTSGAGADVERAVAAVSAAREADPELAVDGPLQFDAACDPGVAAKKMPGSPVAGQANVFVFPDLEAGNIGYKAVQRTAGALAIGPVLQGLNKPVNDLSRGATVDDIVNTVAVTAVQAGGNR